jgi:hypothetical protein
MTITGYLIAIAFVVVAVYLLVEKYTLHMSEIHTDDVLNGIYVNGKIIYRKKVYIVKEVNEVEVGNKRAGKNKKVRYLVIAQGDDSDRLLKLPVDQAIPYVSNGKKEDMLRGEPAIKAS